MAKMDDFLKNLKQMDPAKLQSLVQKATAGLSPAQQQKLKQMLSDPKALEKLQKQVTEQDIKGLEKSLSSPEALDQYMRSDQIRKRIDDIL